MKRQEQTRLAEVAAEKTHYEVIQAQVDIVGSYLCYHISNNSRIFVPFFLA